MSFDEELGVKEDKKESFPILVGVRVDYTMLRDLELIAEFERMNGKSALIRMILTDKLRVYERLPSFKRWKLARAERDARIERAKGEE